MATEVIIPALGVVVEVVKILKWFKSEGDPVKAGEPLLEIESEKVTTEIACPASGILGCILYREGAMVPITKVAAVIVGEGEPVPESYRHLVKEEREVAPSATPIPAPQAARVGETAQAVKAAPMARRMAEEAGVDLSLIPPTGPHGTIMKGDVEVYLSSLPSEQQGKKASSLARKEAERLAVSVQSIQGTGVRGRVMKEDVLRAAEPVGPISGEETLFGKVIPMNKMRQIIARRMSESVSAAPHVYFFIEINMEKALTLRETIVEDFEKLFRVRLSINDMLIKAVGLAIREFPFLNAMIKGTEIHIHPEINIGLAVALDDGLIVPSIPEADKLGLGRIAQIRVDLVDRARKGKLTPLEIERGTFTISSLASSEVNFFTAILNPPQSGILSVGKTQEQLYLEGEKVRTRRVAQCGLSVDHRIIDGAVAAKFLESIKKIMENPNFYFLNL